MRSTCRSSWLIVGLVAVASVAWGLETAPQVTDVRTELFYREAHPGDQISVTVKATHARGINELNGFVQFSTYEGGAWRADGGGASLRSHRPT